MYPDKLVIRGAKEHNLKDIDITIPRHKLVVITGVSGSGKSSLAFDTIYAEGQRRYVESLSAYARQFIAQMEKPKVDYIGGLSPAIAIEQKAVSKNPRSTVATVTEIYDYLRVLYARVGTPHCPQCGREVHAQSAQEIVEQVSSLPAGTRLQVLAPVARNRKGTFQDALEQARADGFSRMRVDGEMRSLDEAIALDKKKKHDLELVVDRLAVPEAVEGDDRRAEFISRLTDSVETALRLTEGLVLIGQEGGEELLLSEQNACPECGISFPALSPAMFSFNSPLGMCPECNGLGTKVEFDPARFVDPDKTLLEGGVRTWGELRKKKESGTYKAAQQIVEHFGCTLETRWRDLSPECQQAILYGGAHIKFSWETNRSSGEIETQNEGVVKETRRRYHQTKSDGMRRWYTSFMGEQPCSTCHGLRLRPESAAVTLGGQTINDVTGMSIAQAVEWARGLWPQLSAEEQQISEEVLKEIRERLSFLLNVGLHYLTLDRPARTLSGGEGQRIRLASQIGCGLVGVLYVLDEPSIGLHPRDNQRLINTLRQLQGRGNTVLVVEHDEPTIRAADHVLELGPGSGLLGGELVFSGTPRELVEKSSSLTGKYLRGDLRIARPPRRRVSRRRITLRGVTTNNLRDIDASFPLDALVCITGVSGSGKSSLVMDSLYKHLALAQGLKVESPGSIKGMDGAEAVEKVISIDQSPIGRTPRSNPATYTKVFDEIRDIFAGSKDAKKRGYAPGRFSFNVRGGRCEACQGDGQIRVEMHFLPDVFVTCEVCGGKRYNRETLDILYRDKSIADVLDMSVSEARAFFANHPALERRLGVLEEVGLEYIRLGQPATTLSGGEAQRIKLSRELGKRSLPGTLYILDEPTTGLHMHEVGKLIAVLHSLVDKGASVIVIEHNLDVVAAADHVMDLGPGGGDNGGIIVAQGTPEELRNNSGSITGPFLAL